MMLTLQSTGGLLNEVTTAINTANEARDIVLLFIVFVIGAYVILRLVKSQQRDAESSDTNLSKLIELLAEKQGSENDTRKELATALQELRVMLASNQRTAIDFQKLLNESLVLVKDEVETLGNNTSERFDALQIDIHRIIAFVDSQPGQHDEVVKLLNAILTAVQAAAKTEGA